MIYILMIIAAVEAVVIRYLINEKKYWKQVSINQKEMIKKWWYQGDEQSINNNSSIDAL